MQYFLAYLCGFLSFLKSRPNCPNWFCYIDIVKNGDQIGRRFSIRPGPPSLPKCRWLASVHIPGLFFELTTMDDIDRDHDLSHMTRAEYLEEIRHIQQLATCPCTECESRCWSTDEITDCELYRRWWDKQNGIIR